jgi:platelet-activating factor acetylhydrolase
MPVHQNADLLEPPTKSKRWPVMMFSHGLGGSRNAYSHICGSLASHGVVVVAPDHRDGSSPLSIHNTPDEKEKFKRVDYRKIAHQPSTEVYEARDEQLRIRLTEMGLIHDALLKIDEGRKLRNVAGDQPQKGGKNLLSMFSDALNVHEPGAISFAGHSFGACTTIQLIKSTWYRSGGDIPGYKPLYTPSADSSIVRQITPENPVVLLDLWTLPIQSPDTAWLRSKPMPSYDSATGGKNLLAILSEGFFNWKSNFNEVKRILAKPKDAKYADQPGPHIFYPISSAHLSQSDFGVLFPWVTTKMFGVKEPERVLKLNTRAILQVMRDSGIRVANTSAQDLEISEADLQDKSVAQDTTILSGSKGTVRDWVNLSTDVEDGLDRVEGKSLVGTPMERVGSDKVGSGPRDAMLEGEALGQAVKDNER